MAEGDGAAVHVHDVVGDPEVVHGSGLHDREGFAYLEQVDGPELEPGAKHGFPDGMGRLG